MRALVATTLLMLAAMSSARADAPSDVVFTPGSGNVPKVYVTGQAFGTGTARIPRIAWLSDASPLMQALHVKSSDGRGTLVVFAALGDTRYYASHGGPYVRATLAGITTNDREELSSWLIADATPELRTFLANGENAIYLVRNVPQPTADHPLTRVDFVGYSTAYQAGIGSVPAFPGTNSGIDPREDRSLVPGSGILQSDSGLQFASGPPLPTAKP